MPQTASNAEIDEFGRSPLAALDHTRGQAGGRYSDHLWTLADAAKTPMQSPIAAQPADMAFV